MALFDDDDGGWKPRKPRKFWFGDAIYWLATVVAGLMVVFIVGDLAIGWGQGRPILRVFALLIAVVVWLIGWGCRSPRLTNRRI